MKKLVSIGLILIMSAQCLFKLGVMGYFEFNRDYIAEVLCINKNEPITMCYGNCFLQKNLMVADEGEKAPAPVTKAKFEAPVFLISEVVNRASLPAEPSSPFTAYRKIISSGIVSAPFHPPAVA